MQVNGADIGYGVLAPGHGQKVDLNLSEEEQAKVEELKKNVADLVDVDPSLRLFCGETYTYVRFLRARWGDDGGWPPALLGGSWARDVSCSWFEGI